MVEERSPLHVVQKALGHADPRSTPLYADLSDLQLRHVLERHRRERGGVRRLVVAAADPPVAV
jgi:site-specific recombinase XerD